MQIARTLKAVVTQKSEVQKQKNTKLQMNRSAEVQKYKIQEYKVQVSI
jgi:hypothetical protein